MTDLPILDVPPAPLSCHPKGSDVCIAWLSLPEADAARMRDLGLREGACVNVVQAGAACVVALGGCRLALQREVADRLFAAPLPGRP
ncbi:MAG: ferrous iron transport protein A [Rhodothermales bacterium]|nr:ferrous iron transport protein A [Rhodothermales bacterium]MCA0269487.1 ferrous iron transport protein A [Bacteroidota bacterium]